MCFIQVIDIPGARARPVDTFSIRSKRTVKRRALVNTANVYRYCMLGRMHSLYLLI